MVPTEIVLWGKYFFIWRYENGDFPEGSHVLRAKIDMKSTNMLMRDPLMYRILPSSSQDRKQWNIYPMYDYAHGEWLYGANFAFDVRLNLWCTGSYTVVDQIYDENKVDHINMKRVLNLNYTVMSKRKLWQLVQEKLLMVGTIPESEISGLRRRGYTQFY
jgi:glutaminyl-tRNA synthetase